MRPTGAFLASGTRLEALKDYEARRNHKKEFVLLGWIVGGVFVLILLAALLQKWADRRAGRKKPGKS